jgi:hypothetical protein
MATIRIERLGGLAGMGSVRSHLTSRGELESDSLSTADRAAVDQLFAAGRGKSASAAKPRGADMFRYRITRSVEGAEQTIEVAEALVPEVLVRCVRDEFR